MINFEKSLWLYFVPECYFDTILLNKLLQTNKRLVHRKGCNNVVNDLNSKRLIDSFAVAIVDKDKTELNYLNECVIHYNADKLILWKHKNRQQFVIQLNPPLEKWIIEILDENELRKRQIKDDTDKEDDEKLNKLVNAIIKTDCTTIKKIKSFLLYLKDKNYQSDINELINA